MVKHFTTITTIVFTQLFTRLFFIQREPVDTPKQRSVKDLVDMMSAKTEESSEPAPPPVPRKMSKVATTKVVMLFVLIYPLGAGHLH